MRRTIPILLLTLALGACADTDAPLAAPAAGGALLALQAGAERIPNEYIVVLHDDVSDVPGLARRIAGEHGGAVKRVYQHALKGFFVEIPDAQVERLARDPNVRYVEPNQRAHAAGTQVNPTWGLDRVDERDLPMDSAYYYAYTGNGVRAYILDTGVRITHNDFGTRASHGWDFIDNDADASDCTGHGTHVAGTVGGSTYGVAKDVSIVSVRVLDCLNGGTIAGIVDGVDWVTSNAVLPAVANMSLRAGGSNSLDDAVRNSISAGISYVFAAGNDTSTACSFSPGRVSQGLTVGATNSSDTEAIFSNYGSCVDLFAPGVGILSTGSGSNSHTYSNSGTSMASPHVAGAVALFLEAFPSATPSQAHAAVTQAASSNKVTFASGHSGSPNKLLYTPRLGFKGTVSGPANAGHGNTCSWTANPVGGKPPYTYQWTRSFSGSGTYFNFSTSTTAQSVQGFGYYYLSYPTYATIYMTATVTDAAGDNIALDRTLSLHNTSVGCY